MRVERALRLAAGEVVALLCLLAIAGCDATGSGPAEEAAAGERGLEARLDRILADARDDLGVPAVTAALIRDGRTVWSGAAGVERAGGSDAVTSATRFITASSGKTATAAIVLRLVEAGRVKLRARAARYLPLHDAARRILVVDLLRHTSGLPDYLGSRRVNQLIVGHPHHQWTRREVLGSVRGLRFRPGSRYSYSNTNYIALGGIIERVTQRSIQQSFERLVADPLGLDRSDWRYGSVPFRDFAVPYVGHRDGSMRDRWPDGFVPTDFWGEVWTDGGLATTSAELGEIANALVAGDLLDPATKREMLRFGRGGAGLGVFRIRLDGRRWVGHDGLYLGFSTQHWTDPATGATIAVMTDLETPPGRADTSWAIFKRLARAFGGAG